jgi:ectoine hydroxylase-related dioxygenase (phytanoyl-CoA dioxygenase family)
MPSPVDEPSPVRGAREVDARSLLAADNDCAALDCLRTHGACVLPARLSGDTLSAAREALAPFLREVQTGWSACDSVTLASSWRAWGVTRLPRVSAGKKNVHLSPGGTLHTALAELAEAGAFSSLLSTFTSGACTLTETGLSITRPGGEGMEWHADGGRGEATVLLSLCDEPPERGELGIVPGSHVHYQPGAEGGVELARKLAGSSAVWNAYEAGSPVVIDARTLHCATSNRTTCFRVVAWFIFHQENDADEC